MALQAGTGNVAIDAVAASSVLLGTNNSEIVTIGSASNTNTLTLGQSTQGETISIGNANVATGKINTITIGHTATSTGKDVITIGNEIAASSLALQAGTGNVAIDAVAASSVLLGTNNSEIVTIGSASNTNTLTLGQSTQGETISIGNANVATGKINTITIGHTATSTGKDVITIGNEIAASSLALQAGTGNVAIDSTGGVSVGATNATSLSFGSTANNASTTFSQTTSPTAFVVQNATGSVFTVDTTNNQVVLGDNTGTPINGQLTFNNSTNTNTVSLVSGATSTSNLAFTLPTADGTGGQCLQTNGSGVLSFSACATGAGTTTLANAYSNSSSPASITLTDAKNFVVNAADTTTDPSVVFNLQCTTCAAGDGLFTVQQAGSSVFTVNPHGGNIVVGSATTDTTQILLQLDSYSTLADTSTCSTTTNQGSLYYNTNSNTVRACINGGWQDLVSTSSLAQLLFGVVPNSGPTPGDLVGVSGNANSPCKVYWASATTYSVASCLAYSGGREVSVAAVTGATVTGMTTTNIWEDICLNSSGVPTLMGGATATDGTETAANLTTGSSIGAPLLCLATLKGSATTANNLASIYDIRTFTNTTKTYETINSATQILGGMVQQSTTAGLVSTTASATATNLVGVIVAGTNSASSTSPNILVAVAGPQWVKATGTSALPASTTANTAIISTTTAGYSGTGTTLATANADLGTSQLTIATSCTTNTVFALTDCQFSQFTDININ